MFLTESKVANSFIMPSFFIDKVMAVPRQVLDNFTKKDE
jgi:hypothetical protein